MSAGNATFCKRRAAVRASVGLFAGVGPLVLGNVALMGEPFWAHGASVGLLAGVGPLVPGNVALLAETLGAH